MKYLFDTGILVSIERKKGHVIKQLNFILKGEDALQITLLNYAEFYYGYAGKAPTEKRDAELFLDTFEQLTVNKESAKLYAELSYKYAKKGLKVEAFDMLIASIAIEKGATLLTTDRDFEKIEELKKEIIIT